MTVREAIETLCEAEEVDLHEAMGSMGTIERVSYLRALREALGVMREESNRIAGEINRELAERYGAKRPV